MGEIKELKEVWNFFESGSQDMLDVFRGKAFMGKPPPPISPPQIESTLSSQDGSRAFRESERRKKGLRATILAGGADNSPSQGGNTLLGGG